MSGNSTLQIASGEQEPAIHDVIDTRLLQVGASRPPGSIGDVLPIDKTQFQVIVGDYPSITLVDHSVTGGSPCLLPKNIAGSTV